MENVQLINRVGGLIICPGAEEISIEQIRAEDLLISGNLC